MTEMGLTFRKEMGLEDWEKLGRQIFRVEAAWQWWIGDWINYGEQKWGETYKAAIEVTGRSASALKSVASVCKDFELCRRRHKLSFKHHAEVQSLEPEKQDEVLARAETEGLTTRQVREIVKGPSPEKGVVERLCSLWGSATDDQRAEFRRYIEEAD